MRTTRTLLVVGVAALAIAGVATAAAINTHTLTVRLPDGGIERIIYTGNVAPRVEVAPPVAAASVAWQSAAVFDDPAFAAMNQISAQMDREMAAMIGQADTLGSRTLAGSGPLTIASTGDLPAGAQSFSFVSTSSGGGVCSRSVEITSAGEGQKPRVVSQSFGHCGAAAAPTMSRSLETAPADTPRSGQLFRASYHSAAGGSSGNGPA